MCCLPHRLFHTIFGPILPPTMNQDKPTGVPEDVKQKVAEMAAEASKDICFKGGEISDRKKQISFIEGGLYGYSLALPELTAKEEEIAKLKEEVERLKEESAGHELDFFCYK